MSKTKTCIISLNSKARVYHQKNCRFATAMPDRYRKELTKHRAVEKGYRPCKCCNTMSYHFRTNRHELEKYASAKNMKLFCQSRLLFVQTPVGLWKICYSAKSENFVLYHGNRSNPQLAPREMKTAFFHRQTDELTADSIMQYLVYIHKHDDYRRRVAQAGGNEKAVTIGKKYEQQRERRFRREARRRLDDIFASIERKNPEYAKLAFR